MPQERFRCGHVAVIGRPNVGKSTLINALLGRKVSIVTHKPQTTRHRILAVHSLPGAQVIFVDTPGMHRNASRAMNRMMNRTAANAASDADLLLFVTEAGQWTPEDQDIVDRLLARPVPAIALLNKTDTVHPRERLLGELETMSGRYDFQEVIPVSATKGTNLDRLVSLIPPYLPESAPLFPEGTISDRSESFRAGELIREKLTLHLQQELPYGLAVQIERYEEDDQGIAIDAVIWVERRSQKGIVVGKGGQMLKKIGRAARLELKQQLGVPVHLELWVKVRDNWADNESDLQRLGYGSP